MFLALTLDDGDHLRDALAALGPTTALQGARPSAVGVGTLDGSDLLIGKRPGSLGPVDLVADARGARSDTFVLCASDEPPPFAEEHTPPIRYRGWLFAGGGAAPSAARSPRERALERVPEFLRRQLPGRGSLDLAFLLFLDELRGAGLLGSATPDAAECVAPFAAATRALRAVEGDALPPLVAMSRRCLLAARGAAPLWQRRLQGVPGAEKLRAIAVTDAPTTPAEWTEVPKGSLVSVGRSLEPVLHAWTDG